MGTLIIISIVVGILLSIFYVIGFWSAKVAGQVELILLAIANLKPKHQRTLKIPDKLALPIKKFILNLVHRRQIHAARKKAKRESKRLRKEATKKTVPS